MRKTLVTIFLSLFPVCSSFASERLEYTPNLHQTKDEAIATIKLSLIEQLPQYVPDEIEIDEVHFKITNEVIKKRFIVGRARRQVTEVLVYKRISEILLYKKRSYFIVMVKGSSGQVLYRLYALNKEAAEDFIDALSVLKKGAGE